MPLEEIKVTISEEDQSDKRFVKDFEAMAKGRSVSKKPGVEMWFNSLESLRQFLTPQRQFLYRVLRRREVSSVYELAKMLGRDYKAVTEDLKVLEQNGLVTFQTAVVNGRARSRPILTHRKLTIEFS